MHGRRIERATITPDWPSSSAQSVEAQSITLRQGGVVQMTTGQVDLAAAGVGVIRASDVRVGPGYNVVATLADKAVIEESLAPAIIARQEARLDQSAAGVLVSNRITLSNSAVIMAVADTVEGDVRVQVKPQVAAVFGAAFGAALSVALLLGRRRR